MSSRREILFCELETRISPYFRSRGGVFVRYPAQFIRCGKWVRARIAETQRLRDFDDAVASGLSAMQGQAY